MKKQYNNTSSWKEKNIELWLSLAEVYIIIKISPSTKLILKFINMFFRIMTSIVIKKIICYFFPHF